MYPHVVSYLLQTYGTDVNITSTEDEITKFIQPPNKTPLQYAGKLVDRTLCCEDVHEKLDFNEISIEGQDKYLGQRMTRYRSTQIATILHDLTFHAISLLKLQEGYQELFPQI